MKILTNSNKEFLIEGAIFDFDGTLVDSMSVWEELDRIFCEKQKIELGENYLEGIVALGYEETVRFFLDNFDLKMTFDEILQYFNELASEQYLTAVECKPGAFEFVEELKRHDTKIAIATSLNNELLQAGLKGTGLEEFFEISFHCDEHNTNKTVGKIFQVTAEALQVDNSKCIVFEDILPAIKSANDIGMSTIGIYDIHRQQDSEGVKLHADHFITSFDELSVMKLK